jgi:hypothetical protein
MAKTESTAVNELIDLMSKGKQIADEPAPDLFSAPRSTTVNPPRVTSTVPPMRGAGEVAPLPRGRAPQSTSNHSLPAIPSAPVRMSTAPEARGTTIPPLSSPSGASKRASTPIPSAPARASTPIPSAPQRASTPIPSAPHRASTPSARLPVPQPSGRASLPPPRTTPRATLPPTAPVAAPFEPRRSSADASPQAAIPQQYPVVLPPAPSLPPAIDATADVVHQGGWFEPGRVGVEEVTWDGTARVARSRKETIAIVKKLIAPTIILAIVGIMVGGYFAFDGQGGRKKAAKPAVASVAPSEARVHESEEIARAPKPSPESPNAATSSAGGEQPQPPPKAAQVPPPMTPELAKAEAAANAENDDAPAMTRDAPASVQQPSTLEAPAAAALPVTEVKTPRGVVKLVDVRIDSRPAGATVMLVDNGKSSFLGTTPLATSIDSSKSYDVIFTLEGRHTKMEHLDPTKTSRLDVRLHRASSSKSREIENGEAPAKAEVSETAAVASRPEKKAKADHAKLAEPFSGESTTAPAKKAKAEKKSAAPAGEGTLMVSSKPPCEIYIDGKATGLTTPQRSISLPAGTHKVTLVNAAEGVKKTVPVTITADQPTKLIQDLMAK